MATIDTALNKIRELNKLREEALKMKTPEGVKAAMIVNLRIISVVQKEAEGNPLKVARMMGWRKRKRELTEKEVEKNISNLKILATKIKKEGIKKEMRVPEVKRLINRSSQIMSEEKGPVKVQKVSKRKRAVKRPGGP